MVCNIFSNWRPGDIPRSSLLNAIKMPLGRLFTVYEKIDKLNCFCFLVVRRIDVNQGIFNGGLVMFLQSVIDTKDCSAFSISVN